MVCYRCVDVEFAENLIEAVGDDRVASEFVLLGITDASILDSVDAFFINIHETEALAWSEFTDGELDGSAVDVECAVAQWCDLAVGL